jgi:UDP-N-acetylglucosamine 2-epimerase (non-hydrolysing)
VNKVNFIFGTRPEAIKLAPLILALRREQDFICRVCVTGQHREMLDQVLEVFDIQPDVDLQIMVPKQSLACLTARMIEGIDRHLEVEKPDLVLVQGDTTSVLCAALAAFYHHIPVAHVEAGLRTWNLLAPWPEEANRVLTSRLTNLHFAPTEWSRRNLLHEGVDDSRIVVTGNTVIDALFLALERIQNRRMVFPEIPAVVMAARSVVLITGHRRESFGAGFESICLAIAELAVAFPETMFIYPVHLNPNVREPVRRILMKPDRPNLFIIEPLGYLPFVKLLSKASLILTDSGGIQEEAPSLRKPVLLMRDTTERPEAVDLGIVKLVGTGRERIVDETSRFLRGECGGQALSEVNNPYGDGQACTRIIASLRNFFGAGPSNV